MWFLEDSIKRQIDKSMASGMQFTAAERAEIEAGSSKFGKMTLSGRAAVIPVEGVLTEKKDFFAAFFGGGNTTYSDIAQAITDADASADVDEIILTVNSPGGNVNGMFAAMDAVKNAQKPTRAVVRNMATSAAYGLVSQANEIIASNRATQFGSVGVAMDALVLGGDLKQISIASTEAPKKRPDLQTEEGKGVIREELDGIHAIFAESIAAGRNTTLKKVNKDFGQGGIVLAKDALKSGMIDGIQAVDSDRPKQTANGGKSTEVRSMDLQKLRTEHPAVYASAVEIGKNEEKDRVVSHLTMGEASGDMETAKTAIEDGTGMTGALQAKYLAAGMKKSAVADREEDNPELDAPPPEPTADDFDKKVAAAMGVENQREGVWL